MTLSAAGAKPPEGMRFTPELDGLVEAYLGGGPETVYWVKVEDRGAAVTFLPRAWDYPTVRGGASF